MVTMEWIRLQGFLQTRTTKSKLMDGENSPRLLRFKHTVPLPILTRQAICGKSGLLKSEKPVTLITRSSGRKFTKNKLQAQGNLVE
jgi:hypothetical protein